jgi:thiol-disulfide isomerase/thioredoxin|tara:strand:+ start:969 stop:1385 length:417 start_codon:yes stop_codon:yes gene_type:complete
MYLKIIDSNETKLEKSNKLLKKGNWIVLYYSDMCGYCQQFKPIWEEFVKKNKKLNCAKITSENSSKININPGYMGVPTVHFYNNGHLTPNGIFEQDRTVQELNNFVKNNLVVKKSKKSKSKSKKSKKSKSKSKKSKKV